ncbi:MAG: YoaK family protein [Bacillota bacterium]
MDRREPSSVRNCPRRRPQITAIALTTTAGFVDAFGYLALYHVFTANMSGNSIEVGLRLAQRDWPQVFHRALPVVAFVAGLMACELVVETARRWGVQRVLGLTLMLEMTSLVAFLLVALHVLGLRPRPGARPGAASAALVALGSFAMGTQNASLRAAGVLNIYTTHVTGTLTRMSQRFVQSAFRIRHRSRNRVPNRPIRQHRAIRQTAYLGGLWLVYVVGAAVGTLSWTDLGTITLLGPIAAVGAIAALTLRWPAFLP